MRRLILVAAFAVMALAIGGGNADACHRRGRQCYSQPCVYYPAQCVCCAQPCVSGQGETTSPGTTPGTVKPPDRSLPNISEVPPETPKLIPPPEVKDK